MQSNPNHFQQLAGKDDASHPPEDAVLSMDPDLRGVLGTFGYNTVLCPLESVEAAVPVASWKGLTLAATRAPAFRNKLWRSDIGVVCGRESGNLCAVEVSNQADLDAFLGQNPVLKNALITKGPSAYFVWCRAEYFRPGTTYRFGELGLIVDGPIPVVRRRRRDVCSVVKPGTPVPVKLRELAWPPELERALRIEWVDAHHPFIVPGPKGRSITNPLFWAGYFVDAARLSYDPPGQRFYSFDQAGTVLFLSNEYVMGTVLDLMRELGFLATRNGVQVDTSPAALRRVLEALKIVGVRALPDESAGLTKFIETAIEASPGLSVTVQEMLAAYKEFARVQGFVAFTDRQVMNQLPELVRQRFGVSKGHCITRGGKQRRGFPGLRLRKDAEL